MTKLERIEVCLSNKEIIEFSNYHVESWCIVTINNTNYLEVKVTRKGVKNKTLAYKKFIFNM